MNKRERRFALKDVVAFAYTDILHGYTPCHLMSLLVMNKDVGFGRIRGVVREAAAPSVSSLHFALSELGMVIDGRCIDNIDGLCSMVDVLNIDG